MPIDLRAITPDNYREKTALKVSKEHENLLTPSLPLGFSAIRKGIKELTIVH
ncbi:MAG: hypothetical protein ACFFD6_02805 [Candidatus Thorarchaeota archaeon]